MCDYLSHPYHPCNIHSNASTCYDEYQVEAACATIFVESFNSVPAFLIYPNPSYSKIIVETTGKGYLTILNLNGKELLQQEITSPSTTIDVKGLPSGIYIVKVIGEKGIQVGKFIKQ